MDDLSTLLQKVTTLLCDQPAAAVCGDPDKWRSLLREQFGHDEFRPGQEEVIRSIMAGENVLVTLPTGYGKSVCYQIPALLRDGVTVVVSPLIALMKDQVDGLRRRGVTSVAALHHGLSFGEQAKERERLRRGEIKLVYTAPERLRSPQFMEGLKRLGVSLLVVDEAHCICQWGHDFRPEFLALRDARREMNCRQVALFTATATPEVGEDIVAGLGLDNCRRHSAGVWRANLQLRVQRLSSEADKYAALQGLLRVNPGKGLVYTGTRRTAEDVAAFLKSVGQRADFYHAGRTSGERQSVQERFFDDGPMSLDIVAATNAFGLGIDKANLRFVVHWNMPGTLEEYYQEAGRAGRDGQPADAVLFYLSDDRSLQEYFIKEAYPNKAQLLRLMTWTARSPSWGTFRFLDPAEVDWETGIAETRIRVGLSHLERLGFVRRHPNVSSAIHCLVVESGVADGLALPDWLTHSCLIEPDVFCREHELSPVELMRTLFDLQFGGRLVMQGREDLILLEQLLPADLLRRVLEEQLGFDELRRRKVRQLDQMVQYAFTDRCRFTVIRSYFGEEVEEGWLCGACDHCVPERHTALLGTDYEAAVSQFVERLKSPLLKGKFFSSGLALGLHTTVEDGQHRRTELGELVYRFKYGGEVALLADIRDRVAQHLQRDEAAREMLQCDVLAAVPSTVSGRAFDPVPALAGELAPELQIPYIEGVLTEVRSTLPQKEMRTAVQKRRNVAGAFAVTRGAEVRGKRVLLVDDLYDSGMTLEECSRVLRAAGASDVRVLALTKTSHTA